MVVARFRVMTDIRYSGVIAMVRGIPADTAVPVAEALAEGGIRVIEFTFDSRDAAQQVAAVKEQLGEVLTVGAGTILDEAAAKAAIDAGAEFLVTPAVRPDVAAAAHRYGKAVIMGALTPTEILTAYESGADAVKLFPATAFGVDYLAQVRGPFRYIPLVPTGGIDVNNAGAYIRAGALAVGVGGALLDRGAIAARRFRVLTSRAEAIVRAVNEAKGNG